MELLRHTCVEYDPDDEEALILVFAQMILPYLRSHAAAHSRYLQKQTDEVSTQVSKHREELLRIRRAVLVDFLANGDVEALVTKVLENVDDYTLI